METLDTLPTPARRQAPEPPGQPAGPVITLALLLNVLWRRRWLVVGLTLLGLAAGFVYGRVVTPLYQATAQVRPGITSFTPDGQPIREWQLKDIVRFFQRGLHGEIMREQLGWDPRLGTPVIRAEFIPRGTQNIQGGNVITLSTLAPTREAALNTLRLAIDSFVRYAQDDSASNGLYLTRRGLQIQAAQLRNKIDALDTRRQELDLQIAGKEAELQLVTLEAHRVDLETRKIGILNEHRLGNAERSEQDARALREEMARVEAAIADLRAAGPGLIARRDSLAAALGQATGSPTWLMNALLNDEASALSEMVLGGLQLRSRAFLDESRADSLRQALALADFAVEDLRLKKEIELGKQTTDIRNEIAVLALERDGELANERVELEQEIAAREVQLRALTALERIGTAHASMQPVRPRRLRAIMILGALGLAGAVALAFAWEYLEVHRDEIFRRERTPA